MALREAAKGERGAAQESVALQSRRGVLRTSRLKAAGSGESADGVENWGEQFAVKIERSANETRAEAQGWIGFRFKGGIHD